MADERDPRPPVWTGHVLLQSRDPVAAARFYAQIGMRPVQVEADFSVLEMRGGTRLGIRRDPEHVASNPVGWDLMVDDIDATTPSGGQTGCGSPPSSMARRIARSR